MPLNEQNFRVIDLPELDDAVLEEFDQLPIDKYCNGTFRRRRFAQFQLMFDNGTWSLERLPFRPYCQPARFNHLTGGMLRYFEPMRVDATSILLAAAREIGLDTAVTWQCDLHQIRIVADSDSPGIPVPEGPHRDGHQYSVIAVSGRHNVLGGETQLIPLDGGEPFFTTTLQPGQAVILDDRTMLHYATNIEPSGDGPGYRDAWLAAFNSWDERRYGEEYENRALHAYAESSDG